MSLGIGDATSPEKIVSIARLLAEGGRYREAIRQIGVLIDQSPLPVDPASVPPIVADLWYPRFYARIAEKEAKRYDMDDRFVLSVIREESRFDAGISSWAGARGLMQIMPSTGRHLAKSLNLKGYRTAKLTDPEINIQLGVHYLSSLSRMYDGKLYMVLAGYNAGPGNTNRWVRQFKTTDEEMWIERIEFRETRRYVKKVLGTYAVYRQLDEGILSIDG